MSQNKLLIYLITFISIIAIYSFLSSPIFYVHSLKFNGLQYMEESDLEKEFVDYIKTNLWVIDKKILRQKLLNNNYIKEVNIKKKFPDKLIFNIVERVPLAKINNNGYFIVFSEDGLILEQGSIKTRFKVPLIKGTGYSFQGDKIIFSDELSKIVQALTAMERQTREMLWEINLKNKNDIRVDLAQRIPVYIGSGDNISKKFMVLESIIKKISAEKLKVEYIDLSIVQRPVIKLKKS